MSLEAKSKIYKASGQRKSKYILIPSEIATDSQFPFKDEEEILITINNEKSILVIGKSKRDDND